MIAWDTEICRMLGCTFVNQDRACSEICNLQSMICIAFLKGQTSLACNLFLRGLFFEIPAPGKNVNFLLFQQNSICDNGRLRTDDFEVKFQQFLIYSDGGGSMYFLASP